MDIIEDTKSAITQGIITAEEGATEIAFRLNADEPESLKMGWPLVTSVEKAIELLAPAEIDQAAVMRRFRYDSERETGAIMAVETSATVRRYYPWPNSSPIDVYLPAQGRVYGYVNWPSIGGVVPGRAAQFAKALRLAVHEIDRAGSYFDLGTLR